MNPITLAYTDSADNRNAVAEIRTHPLIERTIALITPESNGSPIDTGAISVDGFYSSRVVEELFDICDSEYLLVVFPGGRIRFGTRALERYLQVVRDTGAGIVYADFRDLTGTGVQDHPLIDYTRGSVRDNFDFGGMILISKNRAARLLDEREPGLRNLMWGGLYDLRLRFAESSPYSIVRIPEPLYTRESPEARTTGDKVFDYVNPAMRAYQIEMETIATAHLKRVDAWLSPNFKPAPKTAATYDKRASIVIPVKNRAATIRDAVRSAMAQITDFDFNILVVDNHSSDHTSHILAQLASDNARVHHIIPVREDLGIGGCWNEAIYSGLCGRYAVQLDSDDLYADEFTLQRIVETFGQDRYAMVIGSYTTVDFELNELPPGLIDHSEWTPDNGPNNALRINGLGAPRAFDVNVLREVGLPNVSYGEDYAVALRISRDYEIGRIYDSIYLARRWGGNSDSALPLGTMNRYDAYKDSIRTQEICARAARNRGAS